MARFEEQKLYIGGRYVEASSGATFETINPANGEVLAKVQRASREDVERAVQSAVEGQKVWAAMTAMQRSRILRRAVDILRERNDELAALETLDTGKPLAETRSVDIVTGADVLEYYAGWSRPSKASRFPCAKPVSSTPAASRWAWSPALAPGTTRCRSPCGNPPRPSLPATR